jgi:hypothetical protein
MVAAAVLVRLMALEVEVVTQQIILIVAAAAADLVVMGEMQVPQAVAFSVAVAGCLQAEVVQQQVELEAAVELLVRELMAALLERLAV